MSKIIELTKVNVNEKGHTNIFPMNPLLFRRRHCNDPPPGKCWSRSPFLERVVTSCTRQLHHHHINNVHLFIMFVEWYFLFIPIFFFMTIGSMKNVYKMIWTEMYPEVRETTCFGIIRSTALFTRCMLMLFVLVIYQQDEQNFYSRVR